MSRIDFINNNVVTMNFKIDDVPVSYPATCMHVIINAIMYKFYFMNTVGIIAGF